MTPNWNQYFHDKVIWVTGASSGIGEQLCYQFDEMGAHLILSARSENKLQAVKRKLKNRRSTAYILPLDLEQLDTLPHKIEEAENLFGRIDILVNNAAVAIRDFALNTRLDIDKKLMDINYFGAIALTKGILPGMLKRNSGHLVIVSSLSAKVGFPRGSAYSASKHALHGFYNSLRCEMADQNIFITLLLPGIIETKITAHAVMGDGSTFGKVERSYQKAFPAELAARRLAKAIAQRKEEKFVGGSEGLILALNRISPSWTHRLIRSHPLKRMRKLKRFFRRKKQSATSKSPKNEMV